MKPRSRLFIPILGFVAGTTMGLVLAWQFISVTAPTPEVVTATGAPPVLQADIARKLGFRAMPEAHKPWTNGLSIVFNPMEDGTLVSATPLRYRDFEAFVDETGYHTSGYGWIHYNTGWERRPGYDWRYMGNDEADDAPVTTLEDADISAFCDWLTRRERELGWLRQDQSYRASLEGTGSLRGPQSYRLTLIAAQ